MLPARRMHHNSTLFVYRAGRSTTGRQRWVRLVVALWCTFLTSFSVAQGTGTGAPAITTSANAIPINTGYLFRYAIAATNSPTSYSAVGLPRGLTCDTTTGIISGVTGNGAATFIVTLRATNAAGTTTASQAMTLNGIGPIEMPYCTSFTAPGAGTYGSGATLTFAVTLDAPYGGIAVTGNPRIPLTIGSVTRYATYASISPGPTSRPVLTFAYMVAAGDSAPGGITVGTSIELRGGSIVDRTGLNSALGLPDVSTAAVRVDTPPPVVIVAPPAPVTIAPTPTPVATTPPPPAPRASQTIDFVSPVSGFVINQPVTLSAISSAGLPVTFSLVSGAATLNGNILTPTGPGAVIVRATQPGTAAFAATSAEVNFGSPQKASQSIAFASLANVPANAGAISLAASASSGLPISYVVSGPAALSGNALMLSGAAGTVTVRAIQPGNDNFTAAEVARSFAIDAVGPQIYLGTMGPDAWAAVIARDNSTGTLLLRLAAADEAYVVRFTLRSDGTFSAKASPAAGTPQSSADGIPPVAAATPERSFSGSVLNGVLSGTVAEFGTRFSGSVQPATGSSAAQAGLYMASTPGSAAGTTYLVVSPNGQAYALAVTPGATLSGSGTVAANGAVNIPLSASAAVAATLLADGRVSGSVTTAGVTRSLIGLGETTERTDRIVNLSSRVRVTAGEGIRAVIAGFVVTGSVPKQILVRAVGPGLVGFGITDALATPKLQLFDSAGRMMAENDGWSGRSDIAATNERVGAFKLAADSRDAAVVVTLMPGAYTAQVSGAGGSGVVLIEVYDAAASSTAGSAQLVNISTRGYVDSGEGQLVAGFVVTGNAPKRVLIRGIGPGLTAFGVPGALADPVLKLYTPDNANPIAQNDNWETAQPVGVTQLAATRLDISTANTASGAFPLGGASKDAAVVITLLPGNYSAVLSGANNSAGAALIEVYQLPTN